MSKATKEQALRMWPVPPRDKEVSLRLEKEKWMTGVAFHRTSRSAEKLWEQIKKELPKKKGQCYCHLYRYMRVIMAHAYKEGMKNED